MIRERNSHRAVVRRVHIPADLGLELCGVGAHRALQGRRVLEAREGKLLRPTSGGVQQRQHNYSTRYWVRSALYAAPPLCGHGSKQLLVTLAAAHLPGVARTLSPVTKSSANCMQSRARARQRCGSEYIRGTAFDIRHRHQREHHVL